MPSRMQVPPNSDLTLGMTCVDKSTPGRCVWRMLADERFANPAGIMQGGFIGAFCDSSMGAAAVTYVQDRRVFCSNAEIKVSFLGAVAPGSELICTAEVVSGGRRVAFVEASVVALAPGVRARSAWWPGPRRPTSTRTGTEIVTCNGPGSDEMTRCLRCMGAETRIRRFMARRSDNGTHGLRHAGDDAFQLTVDYVKQETIDPLRGIGRFLSMGIAGAFFLAFGIFLILIGILRLLQTETGTALTGNWSWVPYAVVLVLAVLVIAVAVWRITAGPAQERMPAVAAARRRPRPHALQQAEEAEPAGRSSGDLRPAPAAQAADDPDHTRSHEPTARRRRNRRKRADGRHDDEGRQQRALDHPRGPAGGVRPGGR